MADEFSFDIKKIISFFNEKKIFNAIIIILFLALLIGSSWMRFQNMDLLKDVTNGEPIPIELDTFYFLRMAETIIEQGALPEFDNMRYVPAKIEFRDDWLHSSRSVAFSKKIWQNIGGYPEWIPICEDIIFDLNILSLYYIQDKSNDSSEIKKLIF